MVQATGGGRSLRLWVPPADPDSELGERGWLPARGGPEPTWAALRKPAGRGWGGTSERRGGARAAGWPPSKQMPAVRRRWISFSELSEGFSELCFLFRMVGEPPARRAGSPAEPSEGRRRAGRGRVPPRGRTGAAGGEGPRALHGPGKGGLGCNEPCFYRGENRQEKGARDLPGSPDWEMGFKVGECLPAKGLLPGSNQRLFPPLCGMGYWGAHSGPLPEQEALMGEVVPEANSKHGALGNFLAKSSQGTLMGHPGQGPPHWVNRSGVGWGLLRAPLPLPAYPKWAFLGLPRAQCPLWVVASTRPHRVPSILRVSLQVLPEKALVVAGCFLRAPGLHSGQVPELGAELGPSDLRSHPQTGQDTWCVESRPPSGSARALGGLWLDTPSSLWLTRPSAAWFPHRHNLRRQGESEPMDCGVTHKADCGGPP